MSEKIEPALTPEEWAARRWVRPQGQELVVSATGGANVEILEIGTEDGPDWQLFNEERHPVAALALHGQPFGFTWKDVDLLRDADLHVDWPDGVVADRTRVAIDGLADRIAAMLPPRAEP